MHKGFTNIILALIIALVAIGVYVVSTRHVIAPTPDPTGNSCSGASDNSCGAGYTCISKCGPPVARDDDPAPGYFCQPKGYIQMCPICLALGTRIDTPIGQLPVQDLKIGAKVWTVNTFGERIIGTVIKTSKTPVPTTHKVVHMILSDGREVFASPGHPTINHRTVGNLVIGDMYDGAKVTSANLVAYSQGFTYDILTSGPKGFYFANGILLDSTLH